MKTRSQSLLSKPLDETGTTDNHGNQRIESQVRFATPQKRHFSAATVSLKVPLGKRSLSEGSNDRYIPCRKSTDLDLIHHMLTGKRHKSENTTGNDTPTRPDQEPRGVCLFSKPPKKEHPTSKRFFSFGPKKRLSFEIGCPSRRCQLSSPTTKPIEETPHKILDAPGVSKNFYYNLLHWSRSEMVILGLKDTVYYWDSAKTQAYVLPSENTDGDQVTCVRWRPDATRHTVSHRSGLTKIWDSTKCKPVRSNFSATVYTSAWQDNNVVTLGTGNGRVLHWDVRTPGPFQTQDATTGIICGMEWDSTGSTMAIGCNDNKVQVFDVRLTEPTETMLYESAVKALAWHPTQRGILATGAGQNDQRIVVWDLNKALCRTCIDTKSQITGVTWSPHTSTHLLTSHGHFDPTLKVWDLKTNTLTHRLVGHSGMIVAVARSPSNHTVVSLASDDTMQLWNVFTRGPGASSQRQKSLSQLSLDKVR